MMRDKPAFTNEQFIALTEHQSAAMTAFDVVLWTIAKVAVWHFNFLTQVAVICNGKRHSLVTPFYIAVCTNTTNVWSGEKQSTKRERE